MNCSHGSWPGLSPVGPGLRAASRPPGTLLHPLLKGRRPQPTEGAAPRSRGLGSCVLLWAPSSRWHQTEKGAFWPAPGGMRHRPAPAPQPAPPPPSRSRVRSGGAINTKKPGCRRGRERQGEARLLGSLGHQVGSSTGKRAPRHSTSSTSQETSGAKGSRPVCKDTATGRRGPASRWNPQVGMPRGAACSLQPRRL